LLYNIRKFFKYLYLYLKKNLLYCYNKALNFVLKIIYIDKIKKINNSLVEEWNILQWKFMTKQDEEIYIIYLYIKKLLNILFNIINYLTYIIEISWLIHYI